MLGGGGVVIRAIEVGGETTAEEVPAAMPRLGLFKFVGSGCGCLPEFRICS